MASPSSLSVIQRLMIDDFAQKTKHVAEEILGLAPGSFPSITCMHEREATIVLSEASIIHEAQLLMIEEVSQREGTLESKSLFGIQQALSHPPSEFLLGATAILVVNELALRDGRLDKEMKKKIIPEAIQRIASEYNAEVERRFGARIHKDKEGR